MSKTRAEEYKALFFKLSPENQIHIAIERESKSDRGFRDCQNRYSRDRMTEHEAWKKTHKELLDYFNLGGKHI